MTAPQHVDIERTDGTRFTRLADPLTTYKALRLRKEFGTSGHIGAMALATNRHEGS